MNLMASPLKMDEITLMFIQHELIQMVCGCGKACSCPLWILLKLPTLNSRITLSKPSRIVASHNVGGSTQSGKNHS